MTQTVRHCPVIVGPMFDPGSGQVRFVVYKVAFEQFFLRILRLFPLSIIPPMLRANLPLHTILIRRTSGRNLETIQVTLLLISECTGGELTFTLCLLGQLFLF